MKAGEMTSAEFLRANGWGVGTILHGGPIMHQGRQIEQPRSVRITAIGETRILARGRNDGEADWWHEQSWEFNSRDWEAVEVVA